MTRTAVGTDDFGDDDRDGSLDYGVRKYEEDYGVRKYEEDQARRAVLREVRKITRDAVQLERPRGLTPEPCRHATVAAPIGTSANQVDIP